MWIFYASIAAISSGVRRVYDKKLTKHFGNLTMPFVLNLFSLFTLLPLFFFFPLPHDMWHLSARFWVPLFASCLVVYPLQIYLYTRAVRHGELSSVAPLMTITPIFNILTSFVLIKELPSFLGVLGIIISCFGVFLLLEKKSPHPLKLRPELLMAVSMFFYALGGSIDKIAIGASTAIFYSVVNMLVSIAVLLICVYVSREQHQLRQMKTMFRELFFVGTLLTISFVGTEFAFSLGPTSYVLAIRTGAYVLTALWGIFKLKESFSLKKGIALVLFLVGALMLAFA